MTETTFSSPRLERPRDTPLAGVATALARTTGTDVVLWRVLFVVMSVFGGLGLALYLACYVTIPAEGEEHSLVSRLLHGDRRMTTRQVLLLALVVVVSVLALHDNGGAVVVVGLGALWYLWWHRRHPSPTSPPDATGVVERLPETPTKAPKHDSRPGSGGEAVAVAAPVWVPPVPRPRSVLTPLTLSAAAVVVGVLLLVAATGGASVPTEVVLSAALGVVGLGLVVSAFWGRARGLVPVSFLLALALAGTFGARPAIDHGIGERSWTSGADGTFHLGIGHGTLTLPKTALDGGHVDAQVTLGQLTVLVPDGLHVVVRADATNGELRGPGFEDNGRKVHHQFELGPRSAPVLYVDAHVGAGQVEVRRA